MVRLRSLDSGIIKYKSIPVLTHTSIKTGAQKAPPQLWPYVSDIVTTRSTCADETHFGPPYRTGGNLVIDHINTPTSSLGKATVFWTGLDSKYEADFRPVPLAQCPISAFDSLKDAEQYGATAWKRFKPGKPGANLGQFIGELRDLPSLFKIRAKQLQDIGSAYLNYQFGWKPFLSDLMSFFDLTKKLHKRLEFLRRNNNKFKKRGGTLLDESTSTVKDLTSFPVTPVLGSGFYPNYSLNHKSVETVTLTRKVWFESLMKFYIPNIESPHWVIAEAIRQYGLYPTPSLVYELTPWSWLVDYFSNLGDVIDNLSDSASAPNLVALYAYVMNTTIVTRHVTTQFQLNTEYGKPQTARTCSFSFEQSWVSKQRAEASPFGFGLSWDALSLYQVSILGALGVSRYPKLR